MRRITATFAKQVSVKKETTFRADDTLYLCVKPTGRKSWVQRLLIDGNRRNIGLGPFPIVTIQEAREKALENRRMLFHGENPIAEKRSSNIPTFKDAATKYHAKQTWSSQRLKMFMQIINKHAFPVIGNIRVDEIKQRDILEVLEPIWTVTPHQATRLRQFVRSVMAYCQAHEYVLSNVAGDAIDAALPRQKNGGKHYQSLKYQDMPGAVEILENEVKSESTKLCLLFTLYNGVRGGETRGATWSEMDLDEKTWTIPGERMKSGKKHRVPLTDAAIKILRRADSLRDGSDLVFPSSQNPGKVMSSAILSITIGKTSLAGKTTPHGFRSSLKTFATEQTDTPREVVEAALAHVFGSGVEQAYFRGDLFDKRRALMQKWSDYISG